MAVRNLRRNRRSALLTAIIVAVATWTIVFFWGMTDRAWHTFLTAQIQLDTGDLQVSRAGYHEDPNLSLAFPANRSQTLQVTLAEDTAVKAVSPRLSVEGLLQSAYGTKGVQVRAFDPAMERQVTLLAQTVNEGRFLAQAGEIVLGQKLAEQLDVRLGERVVLQTSGLARTRSKGFRLVGMLYTGVVMMDQSFAYIGLQDTLALTEAPGPTEIVLALNPGANAARAQARLQGGLGVEVEVMTFAMLNPMIYNMISYSTFEMMLWMAILAALAGFGVANTILFSVMQRTRQFGIMLGLGMKPKRLARMVTLESLLTTVIGFIIGAAAGLGVNFYLETVGFNLQAYTDAFPALGMPQVLYSKADVAHALYAFAILILTALVSARYPARRVVKLEPTEAMKFA